MNLLSLRVVDTHWLYRPLLKRELHSLHSPAAEHLECLGTNLSHERGSCNPKVSESKYGKYDPLFISWCMLDRVNLFLLHVKISSQKCRVSMNKLKIRAWLILLLLLWWIPVPPQSVPPQSVRKCQENICHRAMNVNFCLPHLSPSSLVSQDVFFYLLPPF